MTNKASRYLRVRSDGTFFAAIAYTALVDTDCAVNIYGAYFGYVGGAVYDGGYFHIDIEADVHDILSYDDAESSEQKELLQEMISICCEFRNDEDPSECTEAANQLLENANDEQGDKVFMDDDFDGDILSEVSELWEIRILFES